MHERPHPLTWLALSVLTGLGLWLRLPGLWTGYAPDELANIIGTGVWGQVAAPESGVNPPLLRLLTNPWFDEWIAPQVGRFISLCCSVATIPATFALALRTSRSDLGALLAAALIAVAPPMVLLGTRFRAYAAFAFVATLHLSSLTAFIDAGRQRAATAVTAVLLVWLHYVAIPVIAVAVCLGAVLGRRDLWRLYLPAALTIAPMGLLVLSVTEARVATPGSLTDSFSPILAMGMTGPAWLRAPLQDLTEVDPAAALMVLLTLLGVASTRTRASAVLSVGWLSLLISLVALSTVQFVRSPMAVVLGVFVAPLLANLVGRVSVSARPVVAGGLLSLLAPGLITSLQRLRERDPEASLARFAATWHDWDDARGDGAISVWPPYAYGGMHLYLTHQITVPPQGDEASRCPIEACFAHEGVLWLRLVRETEPELAGLVVAFQEPDEGMLARCERLETSWVFHVWRCP